MLRYKYDATYRKLTDKNGTKAIFQTTESMKTVVDENIHNQFLLFANWVKDSDKQDIPTIFLLCRTVKLCQLQWNMQKLKRN